MPPDNTAHIPGKEVRREPAPVAGRAGADFPILWQDVRPDTAESPAVSGVLSSEDKYYQESGGAMVIPISEITISDKRRDVLPEDVQALADSISAVGLLNPMPTNF